MCVAVIGGMDRLGPHYQEEARRQGVELKIFSRSQQRMETSLKNIDALLIFTNKVSHRARKEALRAVKGRAIPVLQLHSCGVCSLREGLCCLTGCPTAQAACRKKLTCS